MVHFPKLEDSPMFRDQVNLLEESSEQLRDRCQKFYKGWKKFTVIYLNNQQAYQRTGCLVDLDRLVQRHLEWMRTLAAIRWTSLLPP